MTLALRIHLLSGRYVATAYNDRTQAEWPPHPARVFSALVDTHFSRPEPPDEERDALMWLEKQGPPALTASDAAHRGVLTHFVPVNDATVHSMPDKAFGSVAEAREKLIRAHGISVGDGSDRTSTSGTKAISKAETRLRKAQEKLHEAVQKAASPGSRRGTPKEAHTILPAHRTLQARTFPSVTPDDDVVWLTWPDADPDPECRKTLRKLAQDMVRIGHSSSLVNVCLLDHGPKPTHVPTESGDVVLRVAGPGQLEALQTEFHRHRGVEPRVLSSLYQPYSSSAKIPASIRRSVFGDDWVVLARRSGPRLPSRSVVAVSEAVKAALMKHSADPVPAVISGHTPDGTPLEEPHLAVIPLPFIGAPHANGAILGVAVVLPRTCTRQERKQVAAALIEWERVSGGPADRADRMRLLLGRAGVIELQRELGIPRLHTLRVGTWCGFTEGRGQGGARRWATATPIALDRNPGNLRARDPEEAAAAADKAAKTISEGAQRIGLPAPTVQVVPASPLVGGSKAQAFPRFPAAPGRTQRVLTHAVLTFDVPVRGPVLIGAGRYRGLGLCRPTPEPT